MTATSDAGDGNTGPAQVVQLCSDTGYLWFFSSDSAEAVVNVVNGAPSTATTGYLPEASPT